MCGIVAVIGTRDAAPLLLEGLRQLEYRGYDSAGIATVHGGQLSHLPTCPCPRTECVLQSGDGELSVGRPAASG